ncbi:outer membrane protein assembly factor BamE [Sutterella massiliensis]|uniref:Outer membrane protein assembly factor BamE n=1 Tax=Sutterella massiliensis TaxID=1816689 RepID=A0ABS2DPI3_9BURK|nr:outer membrane protein assembly factor BamE [Sutterella massiliensis]MBM6703244.1 outer membrane protein assembly factor BamE [Sutterella massiliensis]
MFSRHPLLAASGVAAAILLSGCNTVADVWDNATDYVPYFLKPYRDDVHQGNLVTNEMVLQLEKGMTDAQVQFLLGVPLVRDQFHADRWDYVYFLMRGDGERQLRKLTVFFDENRRVDHWVSDPLPDEEQADQLILGNIKTFEPRSPKMEPQSMTSSEESSNADGRTEAPEDARESTGGAPQH